MESWCIPRLEDFSYQKDLAVEVIATVEAQLCSLPNPSALSPFSQLQIFRQESDRKGLYLPLVWADVLKIKADITSLIGSLEREHASPESDHICLLHSRTLIRSKGFYDLHPNIIIVATFISGYFEFVCGNEEKATEGWRWILEEFDDEEGEYIKKVRELTIRGLGSVGSQQTDEVGAKHSKLKSTLDEPSAEVAMETKANVEDVTDNDEVRMADVSESETEISEDNALFELRSGIKEILMSESDIPERPLTPEQLRVPTAPPSRRRPSRRRKSLGQQILVTDSEVSTGPRKKISKGPEDSLKSGEMVFESSSEEAEKSAMDT